MANEILPRQATANSQTGRPWSLTRDNQFRGALEASFPELYGPGVLFGCRVTKSAAFSILVPSGSKFWDRGNLLTLSAAQSYSANVASATVYVWAKVLRTAANNAVPTAEDTYSLSITHNVTGAAPSVYHFPIATLTTNGSGITVIDNDPQGKYVGVFRRITLATKRVSVASTGVSYRIEGDFSATGKFEDPTFMIQATTDEAGVIVETNLHEFGRGRFGLTVYVPPDATSGSYGSQKDLEFSITLVGRGWSGTIFTSVPVSWTPFTEIL